MATAMIDPMQMAKSQVYTGAGANPWQTPGINPGQPDVYTGAPMPGQTPGINPMGGGGMAIPQLKVDPAMAGMTRGQAMPGQYGGINPAANPVPGQTPGINPMGQGGGINPNAPSMPYTGVDQMASPTGAPQAPVDQPTGGPDTPSGNNNAWTPQPVSDLSVGGFQNWAQQTFGRAPTQQELQQVAAHIGYQEGQPITADMMARAQAKAVEIARAQGWNPPANQPGGPATPGQPRLTVEDAPVFNAPELNLPGGPAPELNLPGGPAPTLNQPDAYTGPGEFQGPTEAEMMADRGYQFRLKQGQMALENAAAAKGLSRSGNHLIDLLGYGQDMASQEYGNVYNRSADTFERNRRTGLDVHGAGREAGLDRYGAELGTYDRGREDAYGRYDAELGTYDRGREDAYGRYDAELGTYDRGREDARDIYGAEMGAYDRSREDAYGRYEAEFRGAESEYAPQYDTWAQRNRAGELNMEDDWRREVYGGDDAFRRERAEEEDRRYGVEDRWRRDVYGDTRRDRGSDEEWRQRMLEEDRRRFLVGTGM